MRTQKFYGYKAVIAAGLIVLMINFAFGGYAYLLPYTMTRLDSTYAGVALGVSVETATLFVTSCVLGYILSRVGYRVLFAYGTLLSGVYIWAYAFAPSLQIIYLVEVFFGIAQAVATFAVVSAFVSTWFIAKREVVLGWIFGVSAFGIPTGSFVMARMSEGTGNDSAARIFLLGIVGVGLVANLFVKSPGRVGQQALGADRATVDGAVGEDIQRPTTLLPAEFGIGIRGAVRSMSFYLWLVSGVCFGFSACAVYLFPLLLTESTFSAGTQTNLETFLLVIYSAGTVILGMVAGRYGIKWFVGIGYSSAIVGLTALMFWLSSGTGNVIIAIIVLIAVGESIAFSYGPTVAPRLFGTREFHKIIPFFFASSALGAAMANYIVPAIADASGWQDAVKFSVGGAVIGAVATGISLAKAPLHSEAASSAAATASTTV